jgi:hypothetical protein
LEPLYGTDPDLKAASDAAGASRLHARYGWYLTLRRVADLKPRLDALHGVKATALDHACLPVLLELAAERDEDALTGKTHKALHQRLSNKGGH